MSNRREFIGLLGGAAAPWALAARAEQRERMRQVGILLGSAENPDSRAKLVQFQQALHDLGWEEGRSISFDIRWGGRNAESVAALAADLVQLQPDVILVGPSNALHPLRNLTRTIPIVFVQVSDPVGQGIVQSLARPTGNITGFSNLEFSLIGKWLQILKDISPGVKRVVLMISTQNAVSGHWYQVFERVAPSFAVEAISAPIGAEADIENALARAAADRHGAAIVPGDTFTELPSVRRQIIRLAASHGLPVLYQNPLFVKDGGLIAYGIDQADQYRRAASYVDRILKGERPTDLPVQQPSKFELAINLRTAKQLGLDVTPTLLAIADEVIE